MDFSNRSKQHAKKFHKNQQQQLSQTKQSTITTTTSTSTPRTTIPTTTPNSPVSSHPHTEILFTVTPESHNPLKRQRQNPATLSASSLQSLEDVETISDESQNIQVTQHRDHNVAVPSSTYRTKVIIYRQKDAYATSPRPNLLREGSEKAYREKPSLESGKSYDSYKGSAEYTSRSTERHQMEHLQTFVLSDVRPQSFKPAPVFEEDEDETVENTSLDNERSFSTSTLRNRAVLDPKPFQYSLKTGANGFNLQIENRPTYSSEETSQSIYARPSTQIFTTTTYKSPTTTTTTSTTTTTTTTTTPAPTTTTTTRKPTSTTSAPAYEEPFYLDDVAPTTLPPSTRFWKNGRPTVRANSVRLQATPSTKTREYAFLDSTKSSTNPTIAASTPTERPIQSFTARATLFKDNLARTTPNPAQRFVSPYKSLENLLGEQDKSLRTTSRPRYTNTASTPTPFVMSTKTPLRSYFVITSAPKLLNDAIVTMSTNPRNFSISDTILRTFSNITLRTTTPVSTTTETTTTPQPTTTSTTTTMATTSEEQVAIATTATPKYKLRESASNELMRLRGRSRYTAATKLPDSSSEEPGTIAQKIRQVSADSSGESQRVFKPIRRKVQRARIAAVQGQQPKSKEKYHKTGVWVKTQNRKPIENESSVSEGPRAEALVAFPLENNQDNSIEGSRGESSAESSSSTEQVVSITDRPLKQFYSNKYRQQTIEHTLAEGLQNAGYITSSTGRSRFHPKSVLEQLQEFLAGESEENLAEQKDLEDNYTHPEIKAAVKEIKNLYTSSTWKSTVTATTPTTTSPYTAENTHTTTRYTASTLSQLPRSFNSSSTSTSYTTSTPSIIASSTTPTSTTKVSSLLMPMRASRVNNAIKSSIAAAAASSSTLNQTMGRNHKVITPAINSNVAAAVKCSDSTSNAKCNEIPSRYLLFVLTILLIMEFLLTGFNCRFF